MWLGWCLLGQNDLRVRSFGSGLSGLARRRHCGQQADCSARKRLHHFLRLCLGPRLWRRSVCRCRDGGFGLPVLFRRLLIWASGRDFGSCGDSHRRQGRRLHWRRRPLRSLGWCSDWLDWCSNLGHRGRWCRWTCHSLSWSCSCSWNRGHSRWLCWRLGRQLEWHPMFRISGEQRSHRFSCGVCDRCDWPCVRRGCLRMLCSSWRLHVHPCSGTCCCLLRRGATQPLQLCR
mmetsp:Transcript_44922/g.128308  ORF Transcript_44922/g.128308 Transcript_44922/m.128308 type:complete len:231 (+) Transcript_44922:852-1544(+)